MTPHMNMGCAKDLLMVSFSRSLKWQCVFAKNDPDEIVEGAGVHRARASSWWGGFERGS
jgi:hypothetical protein